MNSGPKQIKISLFSNPIEYFKNLGVGERAYFIGTVFSVITIVFALISIQSMGVIFSICIAGISFAIGFVSWAIPYLRIGWASSIGRPFLTLIHGFAFILAIIPARLFVGEATKLPPQYFDVTVGIATVFFYPAAWLSIFATLALFTVIIFMTASYLLQITTLPMINEAFILTGQIFPENSQSGQFLRTGRKEWMSQMANHACGALMICLIAISASVMCTYAAVPFLPALKWIAYVADFQSPGMYPGVDASKRFRLLDNGVVAYAERKGWTVNITESYVVFPKSP